MQLFAGPLDDFVSEATRNRIAATLSEAYVSWYGQRPGEEEFRSWTNSLVRLKDVLVNTRAVDMGVVLEYQLPLSSRRLDCLLTGMDTTGRDAAEIVELKQWDRCERAEEESLVITQVGHGSRAVPHPSVQVAGYERYLKDGHSAFYEQDALRLGSCAYLHNYRPGSDDPLLDTKFASILRSHPVYLADGYDQLTDRLKAKVGGGGGLRVLQRFESGRDAPSKQLMRHVAKMIRGNPEYTLMDDQLVAYETIRRFVRSAAGSGGKQCVLVRGGPGTGKSLVALNLMADLLRSGINVRYATGSKAFTTTLRKAIGPRGAVQFDWTNSYALAKPDSIAAVLVDEAHRIRPVSRSRFVRRSAQSGVPQVEEIMRAARVSAFFIDDLQAVTPNDHGSSQYIAENAKRLGIPVSDFELAIQFRCQGSDAFVRWMDNLLQLRAVGPQIYHETGGFDFRIFDDIQALDAELKKRIIEGSTARLTAGYCWPWSDPRPDGTLVDDLVIGDFHRPWNAKPDAGRLAKGIPRAPLWAYDPRGADQVGCIYTAQGFEFDYVGVIVGPDLTWDSTSQKWVGNRNGSEDRTLGRSGDRFLDLVKRIYRVLFSRGMKGCYLFFVDPGVKAAVLSKISQKEA